MKMETLYDKWNGTCAYCGLKLKLDPDAREKHLTPTRDHFIPLSKGGGKGVQNAVLACRPCNEEKDNDDPRVYVRVWHRLNAKGLQHFIEDLESESIPPQGLARRFKALLTPKRKKKLN
jgi:5-methylcytosine-specific restriction endonuclease McrA